MLERMRLGKNSILGRIWILADVQLSNLGRATNRDSHVSLGKRRSLFSYAILFC